MKLVSPDVIQQRSAIFDPDVISENEALVSDWIKTIEQVLLEAASDRVLDLNATPLTELDHWRRRQKILGSITEQLKGKECKMVIGLLISTKSRLLKKWKAVDISITDAANSTKDRVKYLEALRRHFDYLASENNPVVLINTVLPGLFNGIKQMEIISRFYSRAGYLGLLLTKVSNQLALGCRDFLKEAAMANGCEDKLWEVVERDIEEKELIPFQPLIQKKQKREKDPEIVLRTGTFYDRPWNGKAEMLSGDEAVGFGGKLPSSTTVKSSKINLKKTSSVTSGFDHHHDIQGTKVSIMDEDTILYHLDTLCRRIRQFADVITTLHQYNNLRQQIEGIRKPCQEDLVEDDWSETGSINETTGPEDYIDCMKKEAVFFHAEPYHSGVITGMLQTLVEEDEVQSATGGSSVVPCQQQQTHEDSNEQPTEHQQLQLLKQYKDDENEEKDHRLSNEEKQMLHNLYNWEDPDDDGSALSSVVLENLKQMIDTMSLTIDIALLLDMERREHSPFEEVYYDFLVMNQQLEMYLSVYIQALFLRRMQTQEALSILKRFSNVSHRQGIQPMINECYMEAFDWFLDELKEVQEIYETNKVFREVRIVTSSYSYVHTVKLYNRVAAALVAYETLQYKKWKTQMNSGLSGLSITLLVRNPVTKELVVNADQRIVELIEEAKWMVRLGIRVPETALLASRQEKKFKLYRSHLEDVLQEYQQVQRKIPDCLGLLFKVHLRAVDHQIQPGLYGLTWNSVNIEAFLHQTYTAVSRLKSLTEKATEIKENIIDKILDEITNLVQFDIDDVRTEPKCPSEFLELMSVSMNNRKTELECMVAAIKTSVTDIVSIASIKDNSLAHSQTLAVKAANARSYSHMNQALARAQQVLSSSAARTTDIPEEVTNQVLEYFCDQAYKAVFASICRSLLTLAQVSGCNMEAITKMAINLSEESKSSSSPSLSSSVPGTYSRASAVSRASRSYSVMSTLSEMEESLVCDPQALRCKLKLRLKIPNIVVDPPLEAAQDVLKQTAAAVLHSSDSISWWVGELKGDSFFSSIAEDEAIQYILSHIDEVVKNVKPAVEKHVFHLSYYDFLWKNDLNGQYDELTTANPELFVINKEVERLLKTQQKIQDIPEILDIGCICLDLSLIKDTLKGFAGVWKFKYASVLHQDAKEKLEAVVKYRNEVNQNLTVEVQTLEQLNSSLNLLEELCDMENKIDETYLPIETAYEQLRSYKLRIPREEVREVQHLRDNWADLMTLAEKVRENLLKEKQDTFKQELDKQIKSFVVEVIQLRNSFDNQGPAAPGVRPEEAVQRLRDFEQKFQAYDAKRKTLNSVQRLFGMIPKAFPELDKTGKDLMLLSTLYELFQTFIGFDQRFRDTLWADVDLQQNNRMVEEYWSECQTWNEKLKNWDAYNEMAEHIKFYVDCFPVLHKLAAKEIRNRHWLQVMGVTGSSFPLEANVFKLHHLLDIPLLKHKEEIFSITGAAAKELELEVKMRRVEEEWTEQVLHFETYKKRGHILLAKADSNYLLEQLEDVRVLLAQMLTNRHIGPLREEATSWAEKLKRVSEVLEVWIEVQNLWQHLDAAFSKPTIIKAGVSQEGLYPAVSVEPDRALIAVAVMAPDGETLQLNEEVSVISGVEVWLKDLQESIHRTLESKIYKVACDVDQGVTIDEWTYRYPAQVARLGLLYCWTKDCEAAISDLKVDCKALPGAVKKHSGMIYRLSAIVSKGSWKHTEESVSQYHRLKLENILMYGLYLRDLMEGLSILKVHELTDFDWRRGIRLYVQEKDGLSSHTLCILDAQYQYGCEFYGAKVPLMLNPTTEKCFLAVSRTVQKISGVTVQGDQGIGKTENIKVLSKAFQKTLDPIFQYVLHDAKSLVPVTEVGLFQTCSNLLGAMLDDKAQSIGGQLHIERLFLFCLIWTVGGLLESTEKKKFNNILKTTTSVLPDYEHEVSVFDYFVDESGEWEHWESRLPETAYLGCTDILGEVFVETVDTMIVRMLMEYSSICSQNVLLIGPPGSGKTAMINDFISTQDNSHIVIKRMVFSRASKAKDLQQMIEQNIVHRQGFIYGAKDGKAFQIFLDDLNLPHSDENGVHPCDELLRQLLDDKVLLKFSKPFEVQKLEGLVVQAAMSLTEYPSNPYRTISQRLLRHFAVLTLVAPEGCNLQKVIFSILEANMGSRARESLTQEVHESIALASSNLLKAVKKVLIPSSTPGRQHYVFSLRDITKALQCLQKLSSEDQGDTAMVFSFWHQEIQRILGDRLCRQADLKWFNNEVTQLIKENFPEVQFDALRKQFVTFPLEMIFSHQTAAGNSQKGIKVTLQPISQVDEVQSCLQTYLKHYNEELGNQKLAIELSKNLTAYVVRIHRVLTYEHGGNVLLIGTVGSHLRSLVKLALYIAGVLIHPMDTSEKSNFFNSLKSAIQQSGVEGKHTAILLTGRELVDDMYLDAINSLLTCGEYPPLYSTEEMNDLLQVLIPTLRRDHPHLMNNPMKYFVSRVKSNLHVILCLPPNHELLSIASIKYPGILQGCQVIWICDWTWEAVFSEVAHSLSNSNLLQDHSKETQEKVSKAMTTIHNHVLKEHRQISWVGHCDDIISFNNTTLQRNEKSGKETLMIEKVDVPNLPYSKEIIKVYYREDFIQSSFIVDS
ncbi:dynein axonemal heavy chain 5-like [Latimeria chalumnae]|uniref:dynein axonemal heavy chain 5-like n=1 Tax=Latimeria chalumnae TaxID=7897 RepID=UPI00313CD9A0